MKSKLKSLLALILAMCMVLSLLSTTVWAAEDGSVSAEASEVQEAEPEESEAKEEEAPTEEPESDEEEAHIEQPKADEEDAPAEEPENDEEDASIKEPEADEEEAPIEEPEADEQDASTEEQPGDELTVQDPDIQYNSLTFTYSDGTVGTEIGDPILTSPLSFTEASGHATLSSVKWYKKIGSEFYEQAGTFTAGTWHCVLGFSSGSLAADLNVNLAGFVSYFGNPVSKMYIYYTSDDFTISEPTGMHDATSLTVRDNIDKIGLEWVTPSTISLITSEQLILQGRKKGDGGWTTVFQRSGGSDVRDEKKATSGEGSWDTLPLKSGQTYEFRLYYVDKYGNPGKAATAQTTYYCKSQDKAALQATISAQQNKPITVTHDSGYNEQYLIPGTTWAKYDHPLFTATFTCTGTTTASSMGSNYEQGDTLLVFRADYKSKVANNGFAEGDARWVPGVYYYPECYYYVDQDGKDHYAGLSAKQDAKGSYQFYVNLSRMGYGCSHLKFRLGTFQYGGYKYGVPETIDLKPLYFNVGLSKTPLYAFCPTSKKDSATIRPYEIVGGSALNFLKTVPKYKGNLTENGVTVWFRKKGVKSWTKKSFKNGKAIKLTGLKPDTVYQWKAQYYMKSKNHNGETKTLTAPVTDVFSFATAVNAKPKVKSCKVSKVEVVRHKIAAHWEKSGTNSIKKVKEQIWYTTDFTVTYTFAKPSRNIKGYTSGGVYAPVKNGKVSFNMSVNTGKKKARAKKFTTKLQSSTNANGPSGLSPALKYNGKIK